MSTSLGLHSLEESDRSLEDDVTIGSCQMRAAEELKTNHDHIPKWMELPKRSGPRHAMNVLHGFTHVPPAFFIYIMKPCNEN